MGFRDMCPRPLPSAPPAARQGPWPCRPLPPRTSLVIGVNLQHIDPGSHPIKIPSDSIDPGIWILPVPGSSRVAAVDQAARRLAS